MEQEPIVYFVSQAEHCGEAMLVQRSALERIDGEIYRVKRWKCSVCGMTFKTVDVVEKAG